MRPVERGQAPVDGAGNPIVFAKHTDARDHLIDRIGDFCSYCENALHSQIDVEHVQPKTTAFVGRPDLSLSWENFLLACSYCNRAKWDTVINLNDYLWPDRDNTLHALVYQVDSPPQPNRQLDPLVAQAALSLIELTGLDRVPGHPKFSDRDRRYLKRKEVWGVALLILHQYQQKLISPLSIQLVAVSRGFFSIWMTVFQGDSEVRKLLISGFKAAANCFDGNAEPVIRPGGRV